MRSVEGLVSEVEALKRRLRAVILAHNYQLPEVQDVADFVGDSLGLARKAVESGADVIVFAGVSFMAEMAAVLNPDKVVLHPNPCAGCPLANYLSPQRVREVRSEVPNTPIVLYVNSLTQAKVEADYVVTSASAARLISRLGEEIVVFGPDRNLADHVSTVTGKHVLPLPPHGHCPVHEYLLNEYYVTKALAENPGAKLIAHPETPRKVRVIAHAIGSTSQMLEKIKEINGKVILATEEGLTYRARKLYPSRAKEIIPANPLAVCVDMKKITLMDVLRSLKLMKHRVRVDPEVARRAREVIEHSLEIIK